MPKRKGQSASRPRETAKPRPRNQDLPGMADRAIKPLEEVAASYAEIRDRRMALTEEEKELKNHALALMKKYDKTIYRHDGIEIRVVPGEESIKVKIAKDDDADDDGADIQAGDELRPGVRSEY